MEINLEPKQKDGILHCFKTFENYKMTIFMDMTEYCKMKENIANGFITLRDYVTLVKLNIFIKVTREYTWWHEAAEAAEAAEKFKEIFYKIEEKFWGEKVD